MCGQQDRCMPRILPKRRGSHSPRASAHRHDKAGSVEFCKFPEPFPVLREIIREFRRCGYRGEFPVLRECRGGCPRGIFLLSGKAATPVIEGLYERHSGPQFCLHGLYQISVASKRRVVGCAKSPEHGGATSMVWLAILRTQSSPHVVIAQSRPQPSKACRARTIVIWPVPAASVSQGDFAHPTMFEPHRIRSGAARLKTRSSPPSAPVRARC